MNSTTRALSQSFKSLADIAFGASGRGFAGDVTPQDAYAFLSENEALLVDVRSQPEWHFVGVPSLAQTPSKLVLISWKTYPQFALNEQFIEQLKATGATADTPVFFLCRTGGRSTDAAIAATAAGFAHAFNIEGGFEGEQNIKGQRSSVNGWRASNLPWEQN